MLKRILFTAPIAMILVIVTFAGSGEETRVDVRSPELELSPTALPQMINYQGVLTDGGGNPLDTTVSMTFTIYDAYSGGTALWTESHGSIITVGGLFTVLLGSSTPIPSTVFDEPNRWLGLAVGGDPEMDREQMTSVPYAYRAGYADSVGGVGDHTHNSLDAADGSPTEAVYVDNEGNVGIGTTNPTQGLDVADQIHASGTITSGSSITIDGINDRITATSGTIDFDNENLVTTGEVGIGAASPSTPLYVTRPNSGANQVLGFFSNPSDVADSRASIDIGVGTALPTGWRLEGSSSNIELHNAVVAAPGLVLTGGHAVGVGTASPTAKLDVVTEGGLALSANSNSGYALEATTNEGIVAATAFNNSAGGLVGSSIGLWANSGVSLIDLVGYGRIGVMATGQDYGLWALSGENGTGVYGAAPGTYDIGVHGYAGGASGDGVVGEASGTYGIGVRGFAEGEHSFGVYGFSTGSSGYGVYYAGGLAGTGSKSCIVKTSKGPIHLYCQESPENWFEDFGEGQLSEGRCHIELDPLFLETVTINKQNLMKVFIQLNGDCNGTYVERGRTGFDVIELQGGHSNARFTYRVVAKRRGFEDKRLDYCEAAKTDPYLYPELREKTDDNMDRE